MAQHRRIVPGVHIAQAARAEVQVGQKRRAIGRILELGEFRLEARRHGHDFRSALRCIGRQGRNALRLPEPAQVLAASDRTVSPSM